MFMIAIKVSKKQLIVEMKITRGAFREVSLSPVQYSLH